MKILVDEMPSWSMDCCFSVEDTDDWTKPDKCNFTGNECMLYDGECRFLTTEK